MAKEVKAPRKKANGYKFPKALPKGEILQDTMKKQWQLGPSIGKGGFGEVYSAAEAGAKNSDYPCVVKIEPRENGPLYVEIHCYMRIAKSDKIEEWMKSKKLKSLGIPRLLGSGSHEFQKEKYRFIVLERYGQCIGTLFKQYKSFPLSTVLQLSYQIMDVLEYIHNFGYVHADIKGDNLLMGRNKASENQVYLVDFGLASKHSLKTEFKPDPKKAHNGTIEYTSRDAHHGVPTMRGDLEILAYNMIHWLSSTLPWLNKIQDPKVVQQLKEKNMEKIPEFLKSCFSNEKPPNFLGKFLNYIASLKFNTMPDYDFCRKLFKDELTKSKFSLNSKMVFSNNNLKENKKAPTKKRKIAVQKSENESEEDKEEEEPEYFSDSEPERTKSIFKSKRILRNTSRKTVKKDSVSDSEDSSSPPKIRKKLTKPADSPKFLKSPALKNSHVVRHPDIVNAEKNKK